MFYMSIFDFDLLLFYNIWYAIYYLPQFVVYSSIMSKYNSNNTKCTVFSKETVHQNSIICIVSDGYVLTK